MDELIKKFNLPSYAKGKSFAQTSKMIQKKFEGRNDVESMQTKYEMLDRLRQAQEHVKKLQEFKANSSNQPQSQPEGYADSSQNQNFLGGILGNIGMGTAGQAGSMIGGEAGGALSGAASGASMGMMAGPIGAGVGALAGGVAGLFGAKDEKEKRNKMMVKNTYNQSAQNNNSYKSGGYISNKNDYFLGGPMGSNLKSYIDGALNNSDSQDMSFGQPKKFGESMFDQTVDTSLDTGTSTAGLNLSQSTDPFKFDLTDTNKVPNSGEVNPLDSSYSSAPESNGGNNTNTFLGQAMRYIPTASNIAQLASLDKPKEENLGSLTGRYNEQLTDEAAMQNAVKEQTAGNRAAILGASGGSGAAARAGLLANNLQGANALSNAYAQSTAANQAENRYGQQFNNQIAGVNLNQSNQEALNNAQNEGAYDTQKSRLISSIGQDLGNIGKEELMKKFPGLMGSDYSWLGKFLKKQKEAKGSI